MRAAELDTARDDVVQQAERERRARATRDEQHALVAAEVDAAAAVGAVEHYLHLRGGLFILLHAHTRRLGVRVRVDRARPVARGARGEGECVPGEAGGRRGRVDDGERVRLEHASRDKNAEADVLSGHPAVVAVVHVDLESRSAQER